MWDLFFKKEKKDKIKYVVLNIVLILCDSLSVLIPIFLGILIDQGLNSQNSKFLLFFGLFLILFIILRVSGSYFSVIQLDLLGHKIEKKNQILLYEKIMNADSFFFQENGIGNFITLLSNDLGNIKKWFCYYVKTIAFLGLSFIVSLLVIFWYSWEIAIILVVFLFGVGFFSRHFMKKNEKTYEIIRQKGSNIQLQLQDFIDGSQSLKAMNCFNEFDEYVKKWNEDMICQNKKLELLQIEFQQKMQFGSYLSQFLFFIGGSYLMLEHKISIGDFVILNGMVGNLRNPFYRINEMVDGYLKSKVSYKRLKKLESYQNSLNYKKKNDFKKCIFPICFKNVNVKMKERMILKNISFEINEDETIAFIGKTGSGKSTIANVLMRFVPYQSGSIQCFHQELSEYSLESIRSHIGYVFQTPFLFSDTIKNNIFYGVDKPKDESLDILKKSCHLDFIDNLRGFDTIIGEKGVGLSGGEKQRISLARALAKKPDLLILDDMTSSLDIETEKKIVDEIYQLDFSCTKIIISEKIVSVKNANCIYVLLDGSIIEYGTHQSLIEQKGYYYKIYQMQSEVKKYECS